MRSIFRVFIFAICFFVHNLTGSLKLEEEMVSQSVFSQMGGHILAVSFWDSL